MPRSSAAEGSGFTSSTPIPGRCTGIEPRWCIPVPSSFSIPLVDQAGESVQIPVQLRAFVLAVFIALFPLLPLSQVLELGVPLPLRMLLLALGLGGFSATTLVWARGTARPVLTALVPQLGALLMAWMLVRSAIIGARLGGIEWRGQLYKASDINAGRRVFL